jgi:hypothetical protein
MPAIDGIVTEPARRVAARLSPAKPDTNSKSD